MCMPSAKCCCPYWLIFTSVLLSPFHKCGNRGPEGVTNLLQGHSAGGRQSWDTIPGNKVLKLLTEVPGEGTWLGRIREGFQKQLRLKGWRFSQERCDNEAPGEILGRKQLSQRECPALVLHLLNLILNRKVFTFFAKTLLLFMFGYLLYLIVDKSFHIFLLSQPWQPISKLN